MNPTELNINIDIGMMSFNLLAKMSFSFGINKIYWVQVSSPVGMGVLNILARILLYGNGEAILFE